MVSLLRPLVDIAVAEAVDQGRRFVNFKTELSSLKGIVSLIEGVLPEAEEMQVDNPRIRDWLRDLDDICYDARDILDEFVTIAAASIRAKRASKRVKSNSLHSIYLRVSHPFSTVIPFQLRFQLAKKIKKLRKRLDTMMEDMETAKLLHFGAGCSPNAPKKNRPEVGSYPDKHLFVGREVEKEKIMEKLLNPKENHVEVVPIWGMGGVGKTTLARSVYNDGRVTEEQYPTKNRRWLCVGEKKFNANDIISMITYEYAGTNDVEVYQRKLIQKFMGDRFLIVLDDIWDVDVSEWKLFCYLLNKIRKGGLIIITTRTREVITAIDTPVPHDLRPLSCDDCWKIFESHAFTDTHSCSDLEQKRGIGKQIVEKLKGFPLAADVVGRSLSNQPDVQTWRSFLEAEEWKLSIGDDDVMTTLRWSYNRLPPHLKRCFTYCSLFPKDHMFDEKMLVEMWMAHGFIQSVEVGGEKRRPEDTGALYFRQLVYASFFQYVDDKYVMHDMIHDLAILVSNEEFLRIDDLLLDNGQLEKVRHISFNLTYFGENLSLCMSKRSTVKRLLTLYTLPMRQFCIPEEERTSLFKNVIQNIFKQLKSIRVLVLHAKGITYIPKCISELIHLRYLDIEQTSVSRIPDTLCDLHNLQTLVAPTGYPVVTVLPKNIVNMSNLRHLRACLLTCKGVKNLTSLQELHSISISKGDNIRELGEMRQLRGKLTIKCLENVTSEEDAAQAMMQEKTYIDGLELEFTEGLEDNDVQTKVLNALQCPPNLRDLRIRGYNGLTSPIWMVDGKLIMKLQTLCLSDCHRLESLPTSRNAASVMRSLSELHIGNCDGLVVLDLHIFVSLNHLEISGCSNLTCITSAVNVASTVENPFIEGYEKLEKMEFGSLSSLKRLTINRCDSLYCLPRLDAIEELDVRKCEKLMSLTISDRGLNSLRSLTVVKCHNLQILIEDAPTSSSSSALRLSSIQTDNRHVILKMFEHDLVSFQEMCIGRFTNVKSLFNDCHKLTLLDTLAIFRWEDQESLPPDIHKLSSLKKLWLHRCPKLQALPADGLPLSLELLVIAECPLLYERCQVESGADWDKITHIPEREIEQTISADRAIELAERFKFGGLLDLIKSDSDGQ